MSGDRDAGATPGGSGLPAPLRLPRPPRPAGAWLLPPLLLAAAATVAAALAGERGWGGWPAALAVLLLAAAAALAGAAVVRERARVQLFEAGQQAALLARLNAGWQWQTDAEHRLLALAPPAGAHTPPWIPATPASAPRLWQQLIDEDGSLPARMRQQQPLQGLPVRELGAPGLTGRPRHHLHALPRLDAQGRFAGYQGVLLPTDEAEALARARQQLQALWQHGAIALWRAERRGDGQAWQLVQANAAACRLLGLAQLPPGGLPWDEALGLLPDGLRQPVRALQPGQSAEHQGQQLLLHPLGDDPADGLLLAMAAGSDDADAVHALAAEHASFSYTISHDLRAPIRVVDGFARILKEDYGQRLDRIGNDHVDRLMGAAARMNQMIDSLLALSQLSTQALARQTVNLSDLAELVIDELRRHEPMRRVQVRVEPGLSAQGDPTLLRLVLENLLGNAWKYSARNPEAEIVFERAQPPAAARPAFVVRDNGAGFDMRFADRLFGVFQRLHGSSEFPGTGVGLASVQRIVRRHGGQVWAEGEVGRGARFYFTLG